MMMRDPFDIQGFLQQSALSLIARFKPAKRLALPCGTIEAIVLIFLGGLVSAQRKSFPFIQHGFGQQHLLAGGMAEMQGPVRKGQSQRQWRQTQSELGQLGMIEVIELSGLCFESGRFWMGLGRCCVCHGGARTRDPDLELLSKFKKRSDLQTAFVSCHQAVKHHLYCIAQKP